MIKEILYKRIPTVTGIGIITFLVILVGGYTWWQFAEIQKDAENIPEIVAPEKVKANSCLIDEDCIVFGEDGDCNCGCFNARYKWKSEGECFCAVPSSCECVDGKCVEVFGDETRVEGRIVRCEWTMEDYCKGWVGECFAISGTEKGEEIICAGSEQREELENLISKKVALKGVNRDVATMNPAPTRMCPCSIEYTSLISLENEITD